MKTPFIEQTQPQHRVRFELDPNALAPLTQSQQRELAQLASMPDSAIDTSDVTPLSDTDWQGAKRNPFYKATKLSTTVRVDADVLHWLKSSGKGYQTRINHILREAMLKTEIQTSSRQ